MKNWLIYEPAGGASPTLEGAETFRTVREGFSKAAFVAPLIWLPLRRCWLALVVYLAAEAALSLATWGLGLNGGPALVLGFLPNLAVGLEAAWLRSRALEKRGYRLAGSVMARTREEAEAVFFHDWLAGAAQPQERAATADHDAPYRPAAAGVLGLFPSPSAAR